MAGYSKAPITTRNPDYIKARQEFALGDGWISRESSISILGINERTLRKWIDDKRLKSRVIDKKIFISRADITRETGLI